MIFVTVGTHDQQFNRLVEAADALAKAVTEPVVIQRGFSDYTPSYANYFELVPLQEMEEWIGRARVVIAQAGAGTVITVLKQSKPLVLVPRLKQYGENYNDHQRELALVLEDQGQAVQVLNPAVETLLPAIQKAGHMGSATACPEQLIGALRARLQTWHKSFVEKRT